MAINPVDRKTQALAAQRTETQTQTAPAQGSTKSTRTEAAPKPQVVASDSYGSAQRTETSASPQKAAEHGVLLKEQRRASKPSPSNGSGAQLIGAAAPAPKSEVLSNTSASGKKAVNATLDYLNQQMQAQGLASGAKGATAKESFTPKSVTRDEFGTTHVRMDRKFEGVPVFAEQVISHIGADGKMQGLTGNISTIPAGLGKAPPAVSKEQALQMAAQDFMHPTDRPTTAERVIVKGDDGQYHSAWRVEMANTTTFDAAKGEVPRKMNYLVDTQTGQMLNKFNQMGGNCMCAACKTLAAKEAGAAKGAAAPVTVTGTAAPKAAIPDQGKAESTIKIDQDVDITKLGLNLDIAHTYSGDLKVSLTSPSGKTVVVQDRKGGSADDVKGNFDLSAFAGESSKGDWKLTVEDKAARDTGTLNAWGLNIQGTSKTPPPPPPSADTVTKTASPNSAIKDNSTTTSTIDVAENFNIDQFKLNLDIAHTYRGDLKVTLTSPSGKSAVVADHTGGSADNIQGDFDLATTFAGEPVKGQWKLTVEDNAAQDVGTLKNWGFTATAKKDTPPGPPNPPNPPNPPAGTADDTSLYSGKVDLGALKKNADGTYSLEDSTRGGGVVTYDAKGSQQPSGKTAFKDSNNVWGEAGDDPRTKAAVDAMYGGQMTYDFYKNVLGRDSIDGKGEQLQQYVHVGNNYVNAFWDGEKMNYGDGDGKYASALTTLDIAGHEITHGFTERTSGLIYSGESGGVNEAMSDIMGTGVQWYASQKNSNVKFDWSMGEAAWTPGTPGDALRYLNDPTKDGYSIDHYSNYPKQTEMHGSSGIMNNAFYLMSDGGTNKTSGKSVAAGMGIESALKIFARANEYYMTPSATFKDARTATEKAATDMFGANSSQLKALQDAWTAVGVS